MEALSARPLQPSYNMDEAACRRFMSIGRRREYVTDYSDKSVTELIDIYCEHRSLRYAKIERAYSSAKKKLRAFCDAYGRQDDFFPEEISADFWSFFIGFCFNDGLKPSTVRSYVNSILCVLNNMRAFNIRLNIGYDDVKVKVQETTRIALTQDDVQQVYNFNFDAVKSYVGNDGKRRVLRKDHRETLKRCRDMFILSVCLGQRYSDMRKLNPDSFEENRMRIMQQKTGNIAVVNIEKMSFSKKIALEILRKYNFHAPYDKTIQRYDQHIHEFAKIVGGWMDEEIVERTKIGGMLVETKKKKWQMVSSHTGRRSFATINIVERGKGTYETMKATGHKTESSFRKYIIDGE